MAIKITKKTRVIVLGAGASRAVKYKKRPEYPSPLDQDFFDLLQRRATGTLSKDIQQAAHRVLEAARSLPNVYWRSLEQCFYTLHLQAYMGRKLRHSNVGSPDEDLISDFARSIQALLRVAHGKNVCQHHSALFGKLFPTDTIITFNYDLVAERALRAKFDGQKQIGKWLYGLAKSVSGPKLLKLHGSSNWKLDKKKITVRTSTWSEFDDAPGYRGWQGLGSVFPIFLPFWDKRIEGKPWLKLWQNAYEHLCLATDVIVWGYSLPPADIKAQALFKLGLSGRGVRLVVIDPDTGARARWRDLLPESLYWEYVSYEAFRKNPPRWWS